MSYLSRNNLQEFCRICLNRLPDQCETCESSCFNIHNLPTLSRQLVYLVTLENGSGKAMGFPDYICQECFDMINNFNKFHVMALRSKQLIQSILTEQCDTQVLTANARRYIRNASAHDAEKVSARWGKDPLLDATKRFGMKHQPQAHQHQESANAANLLESSDLFTDVQLSTSTGDMGGSMGVNAIFSSTSLELNHEEKQTRELGGAANEEAISSRAPTSMSSSTIPRYNNSKLSSFSQHTPYVTSSKAMNQQSPDTLEVNNREPLTCTHCGTYIYSDEDLCEIYENAGKPILCRLCKKQFNSRDPTPSRLFTLGMRKETKQSYPGTRNQLHNPNIQLKRSKIMSSCSLPASLSGRQAARRFICKECGMRVAQHELRSHMRRHQLRMQKKMSLNECTSCCSQSTNINARLSQAYFRECEDDEPYSCREHCTGYAVLDHRRCHVRHQLEHLPQYVCSFCSRRCYTHAHLLRHEKRHYGAKPYICNACNKGFRIRKDLMMHHCVMNVKKRRSRSLRSSSTAAVTAAGDCKMRFANSAMKLKKIKSVASTQSKIKVKSNVAIGAGATQRRERQRNKAMLRVNALASQYEQRDVDDMIKGCCHVRKERQHRVPSVYNVKFEECQKG